MDEANYMPLAEAPEEAIVCLRCGLVTVTGLRDVHEAFHRWMEAVDKRTGMAS
jgi:hypothetical protein